MSLFPIVSRILHRSSIVSAIAFNNQLKFPSTKILSKVINVTQRYYISSTQRSFSYSLQLNNEIQDENKKKNTLPGENKPAKKKKEKLVYITLIENDNVSVMTLVDALKISKRRNLKLIKVKDYDTKTERATYQLMSAADLMKEEKISKSEKKDKNTTGVKLLSVSSKIEDHDLSAKLKNILKWLSRKNEVRISISIEDNRAEDIFKRVSDKVEGYGKIVQKREKGSALKFNILPLKELGESEKTS